MTFVRLFLKGIFHAGRTQRPTLVQDEYQTGQVVLRPERVCALDKDHETIESELQSKRMCTSVPLQRLYNALQTEEGDEDQKKGSQLLEIYALEIQMYTEQKDNKQLKRLYEQSLAVRSAIPHPLIMGVIRGE